MCFIGHSGTGSPWTVNHTPPPIVGDSISSYCIFRHIAPLNMDPDGLQGFDWPSVECRPYKVLGIYKSFSRKALEESSGPPLSLRLPKRVKWLR